MYTSSACENVRTKLPEARRALMMLWPVRPVAPRTSTRDLSVDMSNDVILNGSGRFEVCMDLNPGRMIVSMHCAVLLYTPAR